MRILTAEDDLTTRTMLTALLTKWGHDPIVAEDGMAAWNALQKPDAPKLVLLDWNMPRLDGIEVCRRLRQAQSTDPAYVIVMTTRDGKRDIVQGLESGANDFVTKPFDLGEFKARIAVGCRVLELQAALHDRIRELNTAIEHVKTLQGLIPICMHCHKIRADSDSWQRIEQYIQEHSDAHFTHSLCPHCLDSHYPEP